MESLCISLPLDCIPIEEIEGEVLEDAKYSGYAVTYGGKRYFTDYGIRCVSYGTFYIKNGEPKEILKLPDYVTVNLFCKYMTKWLKESNYELPKDSNMFSLEYYIKKNWYNLQIESLK